MRFATQENCDDSNSYSLDIGGIKLKCKWIENQCKENEQISDGIEKFDISSVSFKTFNLEIYAIIWNENEYFSWFE